MVGLYHSCASPFSQAFLSPSFYQYWSQEHFLINILFTLQGTQPVSLNSMDGSHQHPKTLLFFVSLHSQTHVQFLCSHLLFPLYYASFFFFFFNDGNIQTNTEKIKFVRNRVHDSQTMVCPFRGNNYY